MKYWVYLFLCGVMLGISACNTIQGVGEDMEAVGNYLGRTAEDNRNY